MFPKAFYSFVISEIIAIKVNTTDYEIKKETLMQKNQTKPGVIWF